MTSRSGSSPVASENRSLSPLPIAWLSQLGQRRALLCLVTAIGWSVLTLYTGLVTSLLGLMVILVVDGLTTGSVAAQNVSVAGAASIDGISLAGGLNPGLSRDLTINATGTFTKGAGTLSARDLSITARSGGRPGPPSVASHCCTARARRSDSVWL